MRLTRSSATLPALTLVAALVFGPVSAQESADDETLIIELNAVQATEDGCAFSFLITNDLPAQIEAMVLEAVLFDEGGQVERLTLFDFGSLPAGRPRVRQFVVPGTSCEVFGSILINGAQSCEVNGTASSICESGLQLETRVTIDLIG